MEETASFAEGDEIFIDPVVLTREPDGPEMTDHRVDWKKQYEIWNHANGIISSPCPSQQDLVVAIIQLQRAVELRDKMLDELYSFTKIPNKTAKAPYPIMEDLGIIRPTMKVRLRELRNRLAHDTEEPPLERDACELLSDTAWYYLKATDRLTQQCVSVLDFNYWMEKTSVSMFSVRFDRTTWNAQVEGSVSPKLLVGKESADCLSIRLRWSRIEAYNQDLKFRGDLTGSKTALDKLTRYFFDESVL